MTAQGASGRQAVTGNAGPLVPLGGVTTLCRQTRQGPAGRTAPHGLLTVPRRCTGDQREMSAKMMTRPQRCWHTARPLTHPLDASEKGDGVKPTQQVECVIWQGRKREYQAAAAAELTACHREPSHWSWIVPTCGTELCIESEHLVVHAPLRLSYPYGVCVYCGRIAGSRDHLLPRNWTGDAKRAFVVTVPACGKCNTLLGDALTWSMTERRAIAHARLRHNMRRTLATMERSPEELAEFGSCLREYITSALSAKREVERMLSWPEDPHYDMRAMHKSGIDNPWAAGLLMVDDEELAAVVRAMT